MMKQLRHRGNVRTLSYCIRQDISKNVCNIGDKQLYNQCHSGTKRAIEKYIDEVIKCIKTIYSADLNQMSRASKLEFFAETRHAYGRTALLLSGGATFGKFHFGLIRALYEQDLFPRIVCGSSVGSLIAAGLCSVPYHEMHKVSHTSPMNLLASASANVNLSKDQVGLGDYDQKRSLAGPFIVLSHPLLSSI